jgi:catechol 2,3-dioxygenase-like lactoylglutathione lyase family enzyme
MGMIRALKFVTIPTSDQDRALAFWTEKVGFRAVTDQPMGDDQRWIELAIPGAQTKIVLFTQEGHEARVGTRFNGAFACSDVDYTSTHLAARGVRFVEQTNKQRWGEYAVFADEDGNSFVLASR